VVPNYEGASTDMIAKNAPGDPSCEGASIGTLGDTGGRSATAHDAKASTVQRVLSVCEDFWWTPP